MKKLVKELWPRESRIIREECDGPYYRVQRRDPSPPFRPRNKRYHMQASFNNTPWKPTHSGYYDIDPRAWDKVLFIASAIRIICKDVTASHGEMWYVCLLKLSIVTEDGNRLGTGFHSEGDTFLSQPRHIHVCGGRFSLGCFLALCSHTDRIDCYFSDAAIPSFHFFRKYPDVPDHHCAYVARPLIDS